MNCIGLPNCTIVPHVASATTETRQAISVMAVDNLLGGLFGRPMPSCLNPEAGREIAGYRPALFETFRLKSDRITQRFIFHGEIEGPARPFNSDAKRTEAEQKKAVDTVVSADREAVR